MSKNLSRILVIKHLHSAAFFIKRALERSEDRSRPLKDIEGDSIDATGEIMDALESIDEKTEKQTLINGSRDMSQNEVSNYRSELDRRREELNQKKRSVNSLTQVIEMEKVKILNLEMEVKKLENQENRKQRKAQGYLQPVSQGDGISPEQQKAIARGQTRERSRRVAWDARNYHLDYIITRMNRKARIDVAFDPTEKKYLITIYKGRKLTEQVALPLWNKIGVKGFIDSKCKTVVPWKQIEQGQSWSKEIEICPFYIEKNWTPQNVVLFKALRSGSVSLS